MCRRYFRFPFPMKPSSRRRSASPASLSGLEKKIAEARELADNAREEARAAKATYKRARQNFKALKQAAKEAKRAVKALEQMLIDESHAPTAVKSRRPAKLKTLRRTTVRVPKEELPEVPLVPVVAAVEEQPETSEQ